MSRSSPAGFRLARTALVLALCVAARAQSPVIVVDVNNPPPAPGVDYAQISSAVAAAAGGEIVLVHPGTYQPFTVDGKSLTIVADGVVTVTGSVVVHGLASNQAVVLRGLTSTGKATEAGLRIDGCAGPVWAEACNPTGGNGGTMPDGVLITTSLAVTLVRCDIQGGGGVGGSQFSSPSGSAGLRLRTSLVAAWDLTSDGGDGSWGWDNGGSGGSGVLVWQGGQLAASGGSFTGGKGYGGESHYDSLCGCDKCWLAGFGGSGLMTDGDCSAGLRNVTLQGGAGAYNPDSFCLGGDGYPLFDSGNHVVQLAGNSRALRLNAPAVEGETMQMSLLGEPGDAALVLASFTPGYTVLPFGTLSLTPQLLAVIGALPPSGDLQLGITVPELGPGVEGLLLLAQPLFQPAGGGKLLGSPSATVLLDSQF